MIHTPERAKLATPVDTYRHSVKRNRVDLVGMIHIAEPAYYDQIQELVDTRDSGDAVVHYERVKRSTPEQIAAASPQVVLIAEQLSTMLKGVYAIFETLDLGLVKQLDELDYREHWENHDATELDIASRLGSFAIRRNLRAVKLLSRALKHMDTAEQKKLTKDAILKGLSSSLEKDATEPSHRFLKYIILGSSDKVIVDYRNEIALSAFDEQVNIEPKSDVVLIWGAAHLRGLGRGLLERGFEKTAEEKIVAIS